MKVEIRKNRYGINAGCLICGRRQDGWRPQPLVVYHKADNEKRGHNEPLCSRECAEKLVERLKGEGYERECRLTLPEVAQMMRSMDGKNHKVFWEEPEGEE